MVGEGRCTATTGFANVDFCFFAEFLWKWGPYFVIVKLGQNQK